MIGGNFSNTFQISYRSCDFYDFKVISRTQIHRDCYTSQHCATYLLTFVSRNHYTFFMHRMISFFLTFVINLALLPTSVSAQSSLLNLETSTYFGGSDGETMRDIFIDNQGYIYTAITTESLGLLY